MIWPVQWRRFLDHHKMPELTVLSWIHWQKCCCYYIPTQYQPSPLGSKGWRSGESAHLPPMWLEFKSWRRGHMWVEFVVGSLLCSERFFSGYSSFPLSSKTNISKFQFDQEWGRQITTLWMCYLQIIIYLFIIHLLTAENFAGSKMVKWMHFRSTLRAPIWNINWRLLYVFIF